MSKYFYAIWLGIACSIVGFGLFDWQFWLIMVPTVLFVEGGQNE